MLAIERLHFARNAQINILNQVWQQLQIERTKIRERDLAPTMRYTGEVVDSTEFVTSSEDEAFASMITKVEGAIKALTGQDSDDE